MKIRLKWAQMVWTLPVIFQNLEINAECRRRLGTSGFTAEDAHCVYKKVIAEVNAAKPEVSLLLPCT
jgi:hypothetical protein